jgi:AraC-like DNA-binding protein
LPFIISFCKKMSFSFNFCQFLQFRFIMLGYRALATRRVLTCETLACGLTLNCVRPLFFWQISSIYAPRCAALVRFEQAGEPLKWALNHGGCSVIRLEYLAPPPDLRAYISTYYLFESDEPHFADIERADVSQLRAFLSGSGEISFPNGKKYNSFPLSLFGPRMSASSVTLTGPVKLFGVGLLPAGWSALTKASAASHADTLIDAAIILGVDAAETTAMLGNLGTLAEMAETMNQFARLFETHAQKVPHWFIRAVDEWLEQHLSPDIVDLEKTTGLSRRQIDKMTKQIYGASPKLLQRKYRALRTANSIASGSGDWQDFIDDAYYDQSHCIREIKEFVGITPGAIKEHASRLSELTFGRSQLAGTVAPLSAQT